WACSAKRRAAAGNGRNRGLRGAAFVVMVQPSRPQKHRPASSTGTKNEIGGLDRVETIRHAQRAGRRAELRGERFCKSGVHSFLKTDNSSAGSKLSSMSHAPWVVGTENSIGHDSGGLTFRMNFVHLPNRRGRRA